MQASLHAKTRKGHVLKLGDGVYFCSDNYGCVGPRLVVELNSGAVKIWHSEVINSADKYGARNAPSVRRDQEKDSSKAEMLNPCEAINYYNAPEVTVSKACGSNCNRLRKKQA